MNIPMETLLTSEQSVQAEQGIISVVLQGKNVMDELAGTLHPEDFQEIAFRHIYEAALSLYSKNEPIDLVTVSAKLQQAKVLEEIGGVSNLSRIARTEFTTGYTGHYAKIIKRQSIRVKGMALAGDIQAITKEDDFETPEEYLQLLDTMFTQMRPELKGAMKSFADTEQDFMESLLTQESLIKTGFENFDTWSGGIGRGWLYILAGRPSIGKTARALQMATNMSRQNAGDVLVYSLEMTRNQLKERIMSNITGINYSRIRQKDLGEFELKLIQKAYTMFNQYPMMIDDSSGVTFDQVRATARQIHRQKGRIGAIFVDYLTRMNIKQQKGETWSRAVGDVAKRFKWLAQELDCPVILLAQLSREGAEGAPQLHHLRDSGEIEQEADTVEFLWQDPDETSRDGVIVQSTIAKGRHTGTKAFKYLFKGWVQKYEDYNR
ncbi:Replicative DNA helicase [compost metagenome]